jgi:hypothetical protein
MGDIGIGISQRMSSSSSISHLQNMNKWVQQTPQPQIVTNPLQNSKRQMSDTSALGNKDQSFTGMANQI